MKLQSLRRQYELLQMGGAEKVAAYVSKVQNPVHLMKGCGETMTDRTIIEKVIRTLTSLFDHVIVATQEASDLFTMKLEDLVGSLEAHEMQIVERKGIQEAIQALQAQTWKGQGGSGKFKGRFDKNNTKKGSWLKNSND